MRFISRHYSASRPSCASMAARHRMSRSGRLSLTKPYAVLIDTVTTLQPNVGQLHSMAYRALVIENDDEVRAIFVEILSRHGFSRQELSGADRQLTLRYQKTLTCWL